MRLIFIILIVSFVSGCSSGETSAPTGNRSSIYLAAVSDDGLAVAADADALLVNDGGRQTQVPMKDIVLMLEPGASGVWAGADGTVYYLSRNGLQRFPIHGMPDVILPSSGSAAYVVDDTGLVFVGNDAPGLAKRRNWSVKPDREDASGSDYGVHFYDR